ncbi:MAG: chemotaxis protein CheB [bacterium]|nr:chemotaxis protein CheB [bacterium]
MCEFAYRLVVIGASAGGLHALHRVLSALPDAYSLPVIIVQHLSPDSDGYMVQYLNMNCLISVKEVEEKEEILPGVVYIAPPNYHVLVEEDETLSLSVEDRVNFARPSIDVLFETAAEAYGARLVGIILTGANNDGSLGLKAVKENGGLTMVQDPKDATNDAMPLAAIECTKADHILSLEKIGNLLVKLGRQAAS